MIRNFYSADTVIIVLHEIYGLNQHIKKVCDTATKYGVDVAAPNLIHGREPFSYDQEAEAYCYFMNSVGVENAFNQVKTVLQSVRKTYRKVGVLGYSIGGTLAWLSSQTGLCDFVIGFYGSRIRDYLAITPKCPVLLFFPTMEKSFDVDCLISRLTKNDYIQVEKLSGQHGFADPFSLSYHKKSSRAARRQMLSFVKRHDI